MLHLYICVVRKQAQQDMQVNIQKMKCSEVAFTKIICVLSINILQKTSIQIWKVAVLA